MERVSPPAMSVVIPTFNRAHVLERAIRSLVDQDLRDWELIIVDDGSSDRTREVVEKLGEQRIRYHWQPNGGRCTARNRGVELASADWVAFLDSDDQVLPGWLSGLVRATSPLVGLVSVPYQELRLATAPRASTRTVLPNRLGGHKAVQYQPGAFAVRRDVFLEIGGYDPHISFSENSELFIRLLERLTAKGFGTAAAPGDQPLAIVRRHPGIPSERVVREILSAAERILLVHGERLKRDTPHSYVNYRTIAAVNAARLDQLDDARRHLGAALAAAPWRLRTWARLVIACSHHGARVVWGRPSGAKADSSL